VHTHPTGRSRAGQDDVPRAWQERAPALVDWTTRNLVTRRDRYGTQVVRGSKIGRTTENDLTRECLLRHFRAGADTDTDAIIGIHVTAPDETCRWLAVDIDKHGDESAEANLQFALRVRERARTAGLTVALIDSSGGLGGYHVWVLLEEPIPMADARRLVLWLASGWDRFGLPKRPDLFPGNHRLTGKGCGTWLRLPGRHHKRASWSRVWSARTQSWLEGRAAIDALLALRGKPVDVAAIVPEGFDRPAPKVRPPRELQPPAADEDRELALARDALRFYPDDDLHFDDWLEILMALRQLDEPGRALCHEWSERANVYDPDDLDRRWDSARGGDEGFTSGAGLVTIATLFKRARDAGWPGPAVSGLHYPVDYRERRGPVFIVKGEAAFHALDDRGSMAIGLPDQEQPCLRKVARLLGVERRTVVVVGTRVPAFDPVPVARVLGLMMDTEVRVTSVPAPFLDVPTWVSAINPSETRDKGGR
jgi:hypothetical protein